jgi:pimeloyl-ACP methyl ester carboxylesterase
VLAGALVLVAGVLLARPGLAIAESPVRRGKVEFVPTELEDRVPERFRLRRHMFEFVCEPVETVCTKIAIAKVTFPSPVETPHANNNTVHCEYFQPLDGNGQPARRRPAVIALHILGGDFELSRLFCRTLAHHGVGALFVKMPYYGPRRQLDAPARMISPDPRETVQGMTQAVLDIRRAAAWLAAQDEVDRDKLGVFGISLGGITGALAASAEPRLKNVYLMLAGGDIGQVAWESPELKPIRDRWLAAGGDRETYINTLRLVDPVVYARQFPGRRVEMLNARFDEVIPSACTISLWKSLGEPKLIWLDCGHYTAARFMFEALGRVTRFFQES